MAGKGQLQDKQSPLLLCCHLRACTTPCFHLISCKLIKKSLVIGGLHALMWYLGSQSLCWKCLELLTEIDALLFLPCSFPVPLDELTKPSFLLESTLRGHAVMICPEHRCDFPNDNTNNAFKVHWLAILMSVSYLWVWKILSWAWSPQMDCHGFCRMH